MRTVIFGGPRTGKTTIAQQYDGPVYHTDALIAGRSWSEASQAVTSWLDAPGPWVLEGVSAGRALRKWLHQHQTGKPCDQIILLRVPKVRTTPQQDAMAKGCKSVWDIIEPELRKRGVQIVGSL